MLDQLPLTIGDWVRTDTVAGYVRSNPGPDVFGTDVWIRLERTNELQLIQVADIVERRCSRPVTTTVTLQFKDRGNAAALCDRASAWQCGTETDARRLLGPEVIEDVRFGQLGFVEDAAPQDYIVTVVLRARSCRSMGTKLDTLHAVAETLQCVTMNWQGGRHDLAGKD